MAISKTGMLTNDFIYFWTGIVLIVPAICFILVRVVFIQSAITCFIPPHLTVSNGHLLHEECWMKEKYSSAHYYMKPGPLPLQGIRGSEPIVSPASYVTSPHAWIPYLLFVLFLFVTIPQGLRHVAKRNLYFYRTSISDGSSTRDGGKHRAAELVQDIEEMSSQKLRTFIFLMIKAAFFFIFLLQLIYISVKFRNQERDALYNSTLGEQLNYSYVEEAFPKSIKCETVVINQEVAHRFNIFCSMPINEIYESYFALLFLWFAFSGIVTLINVICFYTFSYHGTFTRNVFSRILPREDLDVILKRIQGTDGLYLLLKICKKEDLNVARDVIQLLRGSIMSNTREDAAPPGEEAPTIPEIVIDKPKHHLEIVELDTNGVKT